MATALLEKVDRTLNATELFSALLDQETLALKAADFKKFESLQDQKFELAQNYQDSILAFEEDLEVLKGLDESVKEKLRTSYSRFTTASETNQKALNASKKVSERIVTLIMDAAKKTVAEGPNYGSNGVQGISDKIPIHFKINEVL